MLITLALPDYADNKGVIVHWEPDFNVSVQVNNNEVTITANKAGLISLATQLLTLAQDQAPSGAHLHYDEYNSLEEGSSELIIQRKS